VLLTLTVSLLATSLRAADLPADNAQPTVWLALFAAQKRPYRPQSTHTFATMLRKVPGKDPEVVTISWLPTTGKVRRFATQPEDARCFCLRETLDWACAGGMEVSLWGPYPVCPELFDRFSARAAELECSGEQYKALDHVPLCTNSWNCCHAVQTVLTRECSLVGFFGFGEPITRTTLDLYAPYILDWNPDPSILPMMGADANEVIERSPDHRPTRWTSLRSFFYLYPR
jgi:hypothetical protein